MAWCGRGDKPLSEPMIVSLLTHICVAWPQWVKCQSLIHIQGSKLHSSDRRRQVKMTVGQMKYLQDLSHGRLRISDFSHKLHWLYFLWMVHSDKWFLQSTCPMDKCIRFEISKRDIRYRYLNFNMTLPTDVLVMSRADSRFAPSQWETSLQSKAVSHWLGANLESASRFAPSQWETSLQSKAVSHWLGANLESALGVRPSAGTVLTAKYSCCTKLLQLSLSLNHFTCNQAQKRCPVVLAVTKQL